MSKGLAVIYDRASSKKQEENYTRQDVKRIGFEIAKRYDYDTEPEPRVEIKSGEDLKNRPVMLGILDDIESGRLIRGAMIKAIIVPNFTRLSRDEDVIDGMMIRKTCQDNDVVVVDFSGKVYDFQRDNDQDSALIEFWFAARDKRQMLSNTIRGKKEKALRGEFGGGGPMLGYDLIPSGKVNRKGVPLKKLVINPEQAALVRRIYAMYLEHSANEIVAILNREGTLKPIQYPKNIKDPNIPKDQKSKLWDVNDVIRVLSNPIYAGWVHWAPRPGKNGEFHKFLRDIEPQMHFDPSLQIISQREFDRIQDLRKERRTLPARGANSALPFSYILKCPNCNGPIGGNLRFRGHWAEETLTQKSYLEHTYRCITHYENPHLCPKGFRVSFIPVASAVIPFVCSLMKKGHLIELLNQAAKEYSSSNTLEQMEKETRAEIGKVHMAINRVTDSIASGILTAEEAKEKLTELREKRERLMRDLQSYEEKKTIKEEILAAVQYINGDLEQALWKLAQDKPRIMRRILNLIFKPHSVIVEAFWDDQNAVYVPESIKTKNSTKRRGRIVSCSLEGPFGESLIAGGSDAAEGVSSEQASPRASSSPGRPRRWSARRWPPCAPRR